MNWTGFHCVIGPWSFYTNHCTILRCNDFGGLKIGRKKMRKNLSRFECYWKGNSLYCEIRFRMKQFSADTELRKICIPSTPPNPTCVWNFFAQLGNILVYFCATHYLLNFWLPILYTFYVKRERDVDIHCEYSCTPFEHFEF